MKRRIAFVLAACLLLCCVPVQAFANAPGPSMDGETQVATGFLWGFVIICSIMLVVTCVVERLVLKWFLVNDYKYGKLVIATNIVSQLAMHYLEFLSLNNVPRNINTFANALVWYVCVVIVLEVLVCVGEFLFYRIKIKDFSRKRCMLFVLSANAASALAGILALMIIL